MNDEGPTHNHTDDCQWFECRLIARAEKAEAALVINRAVVIEEALLALVAVAKEDYPQGGAVENIVCMVLASAIDRVRALAPLPPGLVAMRVEDRDALKRTIDQMQCDPLQAPTSVEDDGCLRCAALAILDRSAR